jgi:hypothetical protein
MYPALNRYSVMEVSTHGSVMDRLKYLMLICAPIFVGLFGILNSTDYEKSIDSLKPRLHLFTILLIFPILQVVSVFQLRPVLGIGQSIYVPLASAISTIGLILIISDTRIQCDDLRIAAEYLLIVVYLFLIINSVAQIFQWSSQEIVPVKTEDFRFSPFASILRSPNRVGYFESDPEKFAIFSLVSFTLFAISQVKVRRYLGICLVFFVGSTTQSRLFYLGIILILILQLLHKISLLRDFYLRLIVLVSLGFAYTIILTRKENVGSDLANFSSRTYIWEVVKDHWDDFGKATGHSGSFSIYSHFLENTSRFRAFHAHSMILQILWDWGVLGIILFSIVVTVMITYLMIIPWPGFLLGVVFFFEGLIEPVFTISIQSTETLFLLILMKYMFAQGSLQNLPKDRRE